MSKLKKKLQKNDLELSTIAQPKGNWLLTYIASPPFSFLNWVIPKGCYEVLTTQFYRLWEEERKIKPYGTVHWKGYSSSEDTWEPIGGLSNCLGSIQDFVRYGKKVKILPLPGDVDVICGGPPCQGISGYNRYRNVDSPLDDERNHQIVVFMDIVKFLKPKYVLMENVVDILRFDKASLGRYALSRLVHMKYQARLGILAAGCYGLPQFRLRVFLWGAHPCEVNLPQFPLPTHDVIIRYWPPPEFERNTVAYDEDQPRVLEEALVLHDAISDLPAVTNDETSEEMSYQKPPGTDFQRYIRSTQYEMMGSVLDGTMKTKVSLYDHRPYPLFEDDYLRGANFRDLPGVVVGNDNVARRDSTEKHLLLPSGKPLVSVDALYLQRRMMDLILSLLFLQKFPALKHLEIVQKIYKIAPDKLNIT
ncbi:unnamed protein product [Prunus armeniaca]|uniref:DNA (cytosine-5-)-methyltransferase n=1 Tax=Prunus armeniaca TaxID=36596 RepID=A0A6J5XC67_PRUAR|nr:unnamed protein product [Prunus armeniaca]